MEHLLDHPIELRVETDGTSVDLPPGVVLTLVENAITHGDLSEDPRISIRIQRVGSSLSIEVENRAVRDGDLPVTEGAGLRFVRAQLSQESGATWTVEFGPWDGRWQARMVRQEP
jgi:LytS/YehU family sensor histidine kinase